MTRNHPIDTFRPSDADVTPLAFSSTRRRRLAPEQRKAEILDVVIAVLAEKGYWGMSFADVAKGAGVTVQGVLHHYPTKDELMLAALARRDEIDIQLVAPADHPVADAAEFVAVLDRLVRRNAQRPGLIQMYTILSAESLNPSHPAHEFFRERLVRGLDAIGNLATTWYPDPRSLAAEVYSALDGQQTLWLRDTNFDLVEQWRAWARHRFARDFDFENVEQP